jgi:hypothetical protein
MSLSTTTNSYYKSNKMIKVSLCHVIIGSSRVQDSIGKVVSHRRVAM